MQQKRVAYLQRLSRIERRDVAEGIDSDQDGPQARVDLPGLKPLREKRAADLD